MSKQFTIFSLMILLIAFSISACNAPEGPVETPVAPDVIPETGISREGMPARISPVLEAEVVDNEGQEIGEVIDVILNPFGLPDYLVITAEGQYVPVPWTAFLWDEGQQKVALGLDRDLIADAPSFSSLEDFSTLDVAWDANIAGYWVAFVDMTEATEQRPAGWDVPRRVTLALQSEVIDFEGEEIAVVEEVLYNQAEERGYVILDRDGEYIPVPWEEFDWDPVNAHLIYLYEIERLDNAPAYGSVEELDTTQNDWDEEISQYWRTP
jgi:sporulation protein YlmC with PRC-barrel domain